MTVAAPEKALGALPDEQFWKRYSPHQEMPLSAVGSFLLHGLAIGLILLVAYLGWLGFRHSEGSLPITPIIVVGLGGAKDSTPLGENGLVPADGSPDARPAEQALPSDKDRRNLDMGALGPTPVDVKKTESGIPFEVGNEKLGVFDKNRVTLGQKTGRGPHGNGSDGPGPGGPGPGKPGKRLSPDEERMLRWTLTLNTRSGEEYLEQLRALGFILAIPTSTDGKNYKIVRDLSGKGAPKLLDEDAGRLNRISWRDDRPESVRSLMAALKYSGQPSHFVAYMPRQLEAEMFNLELKFRGRREDQIHATRFEVLRTPAGYRVIVVDQTGR